MNSRNVDTANLNFLLFDWLGLRQLLRRAAFAEHSEESITALLDLAERLSNEQFLPHYKASDQSEPKLSADGVEVLPAIKAALNAFANAGFFSAPFHAELEGLQVPEVVQAASMSHFMAANIATSAYAMLTIANARLLVACGSKAQIDAFARPQIAGQALGTMCLSEPHAGSSLGDIRTRALFERESPWGERFRLFGNKMWISGGDHDISDNIFHLVLAKIPGVDGSLPDGTAGISLFLVPKWLISPDGTRGERNDVVVAGLNHKMGYRGTTNCLLNFGEGTRFRPESREGAIGYLVGGRGQGLAIMFRMMNEARIGVGLGAAALASRSHILSVEYAQQRRQGRNRRKSKHSQPDAIIEHPDVKRMLISQKCYAEGALSLVLFCARLVDERETASSAEQRARAEQLLGLLTPAAKTWSSEWGLVACDLAIQIHGGYGYTRDFDVEQLYRDNRLNPIHEGTTGIQGVDFVGRKLLRDSGAALDLLSARIEETCQIAATDSRLQPYAATLAAQWDEFTAIARSLQRANRETALYNATEMLAAFGHLVVSWLWLDQTSLILRTEDRVDEGRLARAKLVSCGFFFESELPRINRSLDIIRSMSVTTANIPLEVFE
ncbi:alkylation response protein AidB-like acyl-CoA dehydrogenase [Nitrobacteraceae bacterium AZCC 2161]